MFFGQNLITLRALATERLRSPAEVGSWAAAPPTVDLWAPVPFDDLPALLLDAAERRDWTAVKAQIQGLLDAVTTDGPLGRQLLQFVMQVPLPLDPLLERYRASICVDH